MSVMIPGDYDGTVRIWNTAGRVPAPIVEFAEFVKANVDLDAEETVVEIGPGKCLLAGFLSTGRPTLTYYAIDRRWTAIANGPFHCVTLDTTSPEFFEFFETSGARVVIARRATCIFLSEDWLSRLTSGTTLVVEALRDEFRQLHPNRESEMALLEECGWTITATGADRFYVASKA